ncbi:conjugal transfer protein MobA [Flavobacterium rakeshii]|uniref:conjugal transfer protein MobA n=1 Tax=Flavobacterium rakeshii TaxID=1038845 RepID=UPI002E7AF084|nr:conjugal transfer protein MobA [Flavobacterium rakeshii]MEE1897010.1 conjugal transfer protein MobA [Flavobacterium rakeshii]
MNEMDNLKRNKGGRKPKLNPSRHRHVFRLNDEENARLLSLLESSGMHNKAKFIVSMLLEREIKTVKIDLQAIEYHTQLTKFFSLFRSIGVNYNQVVKILYRNFSEKKAAAYLYRLEKQTIEMAVLCKKVIELTQAFESKHLLNGEEK